MVKSNNKDIIGAGDTVISIEDIMKIANLAKLDIKEEEVPFYMDRLEAMLEFAEAVCSAETTDTADNVNFRDFKDMREDEVSMSYDRCEILLNTKESEDGFFKLRKRA